MTNNLGRNEVTAAQNQKEVTINESDGFIDAKLTEPFTADFTSGNITLTDAQWQHNATVVCTNVSVARVLNTPQQKGFMFVDNATGTADVTVTRGSGTVVVPAGEGRIVYQDGTTNAVVNAGGGGGSTGTSLVDWKDSVNIATTANITLSGEQTIDGILTSTDRVLVKDQTTGSENGIYVSASGSWTRATDFDENTEVTASAAVAVEEGTANGDKIFLLTTNDPITVGTTALVFTAIGTGGGTTTFLGLTDTPSSFSGQGGKVVQVNAGATALEFVTASGGGGGGGVGGVFEFVQEYTVTAAGVMDIPIPANDHVLLEVEFEPATDIGVLRAQVTTDNFTSVISAASSYDWSSQRNRGSAWNANHSVADTKMEFVDVGMGNDAGGFFKGFMNILNASVSGKNTAMTYQIASRDSGATGYNQHTGYAAYSAATTVVNGIRFFFASGNIANAKVRVYKLNTTAPSAAGGGAWSFVETITVSGTTIAEIPFPALSDLIKLEVFYKPGTNNTNLEGRVTTDNFSTAKSGGTDYNYGYRRQRNNAVDSILSVDFSDDLNNRMEFAASNGTASGEFLQMTMLVRMAASATERTMFEYQGVQRTEANFSDKISDGYATYNTAETTDGLQFFSNSGNIDIVVDVYKKNTTL